jgi:carbonic anhydrase
MRERAQPGAGLCGGITRIIEKLTRTRRKHCDMKNQVPFSARMREEKTLIIACHDSQEETAREFHEDVFILSSPGNVVRRHNYRQQEELRYFIEDEGCRQVVVVGHLHDEAVQGILRDLSDNSPATALVFNGNPKLRVPAEDCMDAAAYEQALVELNTIQQCNLLMEYHFIQDRIKARRLTIIGIVTGGPHGEPIQVFHNGISYNNLISLN